MVESKISNKKINVVCLPPVSKKNPYQYLMIKGLKKNKSLKVINGYSSRYLGVLLSGIIFRPKYIHFDWINKYYLKKHKILTALTIPWFFLQIFLLKKILKIKIVYTLHNIYPHDSKQYKLNKIMHYFFLNQCTWIRVFSKLTISKIVKEFNVNQEKIFSLPEGSYVNYYKNKINQEEARKILNFQSEKILLYLGTIKPYKGILNLINTFNNIDNKKTQLIIAGKVSNQDYLIKIKNLIYNNSSVKLINRFISPDDLQIYFNAADAVILPFNNIENSGSAILAMGFKKVIIAPNIGVLPERLKNQKDFLYKSDLKEKLIKAINSDKQELIKYGEKNFNELKKHEWKDFSKYFI